MAGAKIQAVCFDFRGVILDHRTDRKLLPGMVRILKKLSTRGVRLAVVSRFPAEIVKELLGSLEQFFGSNIFSGGGQGKLDCIRQFARKCGIDDLAKIAFVDDKPANLLPVAHDCEVYVIGFRGSVKYPEARFICYDEGIGYAEDVDQLENLLLQQIT